MFQIKAVIDKQEAMAYLEKNGIQEHIEDKFVMCAWENGRFAGVGASVIEPDHGEICLIHCDGDLDVFMGKSILNAMDLGGIKQVICKSKAYFGLMKRLGFREESGETMILNLEGYFGGGCSHSDNSI